jgi:excisionase family DNA binding protein
MRWVVGRSQYVAGLWSASNVKQFLREPTDLKNVLPQRPSTTLDATTVTAEPGAPAMTETPGRDPDVLTTAELATKLGLSPQTVRRMANAGQIPALKTGKDFRYSWQAVRDVLRQSHHPGETAHEPPEPKKGAGYRAQRRARTGAHNQTTQEQASRE